LLHTRKLLTLTQHNAAVGYVLFTMRAARNSEEVHHLWNGSELSKLPAGCNSWCARGAAPLAAAQMWQLWAAVHQQLTEQFVCDANYHMRLQAPPPVAARGQGGGSQVRGHGAVRLRSCFFYADEAPQIAFSLAFLPPSPRSLWVRGASFRWKIEDWRAFQQDAANRTYGAAFSAGGFSWRLLCFPRGNTVPFLSLYLAVTSDFRQRLPAGWVKFARFALIVPNRAAPALVKTTQHQFDSREDDWGFTQLIELAELADPAKGWVSEDGALTVEALILPAAWTVRSYACSCVTCHAVACGTLCFDTRLVHAHLPAAAEAVRNAELDGRRGDDDGAATRGVRSKACKRSKSGMMYGSLACLYTVVDQMTPSIATERAREVNMGKGVGCSHADCFLYASKVWTHVKIEPVQRLRADHASWAVGRTAGGSACWRSALACLRQAHGKGMHPWRGPSSGDETAASNDCEACCPPWRHSSTAAGTGNAAATATADRASTATTTAKIFRL
jgi:hypothetical protein